MKLSCRGRSALLTVVVSLFPLGRALPTRYFAAPGASNTPPYTNWEIAAHSIQDAVDQCCVDGDDMRVSNGTGYLETRLQNSTEWAGR